jgi:MFS family permease
MQKAYTILLAASLLANFGDNLIGPFYAVFVEQIGGSILDMGFTVTVFGICTGLLMIAIGKISDRLNKELVTIFGYGLFAFGSFLYLVISSPWQLFALQVVFAVGTACLSAPLTALFSRHIETGKEGAQWGLEGGGSYLAVGAASFIGTLIVNQFGFNILFLTMGAVQTAATIVQAQLYLAARKNKSKA